MLHLCYYYIFMLPMRISHIYKTLVIVACFLAYKYAKYAYAFLLLGKEQWNNLPGCLSASIMLLTGMVMAFVANYIINMRFALSDFGLAPEGFLKGLFAAAFFSVPMFLGLSIIYQGHFAPDTEILYRGFVLAGFGEEFICRGFLFGLLFFFAGWGFLTAGVFSGLFFAAGHLYQAHDWGSAAMIFLFTSASSIGFGWFYYTSKSLWMVIFLHGFMDVIWDSFQVDTNVTGSVWVNVARLCTIALAVGFSIRTAQQNNTLSLKGKWWIHSTN